MAKIVLGMGTSHTPMLLAADETLPRFRETDMKIKHRDKDGNPTSYDDLLLKADPKLSGMVGPENLVERQNTARAAMKHLRQMLTAAKLDALIVFGDDQNEAIWKTAGPPSRFTTATPSATTTSSTRPIRTSRTGTSRTARRSSNRMRHATIRCTLRSRCT